MNRNLTKVSSLLLAGAMALTPVLAENQVTYESEDNNTWTKVSHPEKGVKTADGVIDYIGNGNVTAVDQGQGDRGQSYTWAMIASGDDLYIGTCYGPLAKVVTAVKTAYPDLAGDAEELLTQTIKTIYNDTFYLTEEDGYDAGGVLVKLNVKTGETKLLMSRTTTQQDASFRNAIEYNGKLYFCGTVATPMSGYRLPLSVIYEVNPETDEVTEVYCPLNLAEATQVAMKWTSLPLLRGMTVHNGKLVVSAIGLEGAYIAETSTPEVKESWKTVATTDDLFGYPAVGNRTSIYGGAIFDMASYAGHLYVTMCTGTLNNKPSKDTMQSFALVRGDDNGDGTYTWTPIAGDQEKDGAKYTFGIDPERVASGTANLFIYDDYLYVGEYNDAEFAAEYIMANPETGDFPNLDFDFMLKNLEQSVNLYRFDQNENLELVVGDATEMFPEGSISGLGSGFGHNENQYIWRMDEFNGRFYVGTYDTSSLLEPIGQLSNGDILHMTRDEWKNQINNIKVLLNLLVNQNLPIFTDEDVPETTADEEEVITVTDEEEASALVDEAVELAEERADLYAPATFSDEETVVEPVTLTKAQRKEIIKDLMTGKWILKSIKEKDYADFAEVIIKLEKLKEMLECNDREAFLKSYEALYDLIHSDKFQTPTSKKICETIEKIVNFDAINKIKGAIKIAEYMKDAVRGFDMYVSEDGVHFDTVTLDGMGDPYNHGLRTFAKTDSGFALGTANPFYGTQIWLLDEAPIKPEVNPDDEDNTDPEVDPEDGEKDPVVTPEDGDNNDPEVNPEDGEKDPEVTPGEDDKKDPETKPEDDKKDPEKKPEDDKKDPETKPEDTKKEPEKKPTTGVNTGDTFNGGILGGMLAACAGLIAAAWYALKK